MSTPTTSREAFKAACTASYVAAVKLRRLGVWLQRQEAIEFARVAAAQEKRARARMAQFETGGAEAW